MSRYRGRPGGYAPGLELYMRMQPEGGNVRRPAEFRGQRLSEPRSRCLVLVHGYNNHDGETAIAYLAYRERQYTLFKDLSPPALEQIFADAFWPGDADWPGPIDWVDFLFYPDAVPIARAEAPPVLADAIRRIPGIVTVDFIAHSLGCRLVLETIKELRTQGGPAIGRVCLMAAAVPSEYVESEGVYGDLLRGLQAVNVEIRVLHSRSDSVLRFTFQPGQAKANEPTRGALGYEGPPPGMPGSGANVSERRIPAARHSDYWGYERSEASEGATKDSGTFLRIDTLPREIMPRQVTEPRTVGTNRELGTP